jgi:hypothetical protein
MVEAQAAKHLIEALQLSTFFLGEKSSKDWFWRPFQSLDWCQETWVVTPKFGEIGRHFRNTLWWSVWCLRHGLRSKYTVFLASINFIKTKK